VGVEVAPAVASLMVDMMIGVGVGMVAAVGMAEAENVVELRAVIGSL
jgi:hypothetical protein